MNNTIEVSVLVTEVIKDDNRLLTDVSSAEVIQIYTVKGPLGYKFKINKPYAFFAQTEIYVDTRIKIGACGPTFLIENLDIIDVSVNFQCFCCSSV